MYAVNDTAVTITRAKIPAVHPNPATAKGKLRIAGPEMDVARWNPACFQFPTFQEVVSKVVALSAQGNMSSLLCFQHLVATRVFKFVDRCMEAHLTLCDEG